MNRYFTTKDQKLTKLGKHEINKDWWSRGYEYKLADDLLDKKDRVLDLGCGIEHPFKYYACEKAKNYTAVDSNKKILTLKHDKIDFVRADIMEYSNETKFDKILLISVWKEIVHFKEQTVNAIESCLAKGGKIIITDDFPLANPKEILSFFEKVDLVPTSKFDDKEPENILKNDRELKTFNIVLERRGDKVGNDNKRIQKEHRGNSKKG